MLNEKELFEKIKIKPTNLNEAKKFLENHLNNCVNFNDFDIKDLDPMFHQDNDLTEVNLREDKPHNVDTKHLLNNAIAHEDNLVKIKGGIDNE